MAAQLTLTYEVLTPLFMGDANHAAELRSPSFKGLLRFWYRAVDPEFAKSDGIKKNIAQESALFGGSGSKAGQSSFLLRILPNSPTHWTWAPQWAKGFGKGYGKNAKKRFDLLGISISDGKKGNDPEDRHCTW